MDSGILDMVIYSFYSFNALKAMSSFGRSACPLGIQYYWWVCDFYHSNDVVIRSIRDLVNINNIMCVIVGVQLIQIFC